MAQATSAQAPPPSSCGLKLKRGARPFPRRPAGLGHKGGCHSRPRFHTYIFELLRDFQLGALYSIAGGFGPVREPLLAVRHIYLRREGELDNSYPTDIGGLRDLEGAYQIIRYL